MYNTMVLKDYIKVCHIHIQTLRFILDEINNYNLLTISDFENLTIHQKCFFDSLIMRFGQLQDTMGSQIFPRILEKLVEDKETDSFIDKLNKLEKLGYLPDVQWWIDLRKLRDASFHDYPIDYKFQLEHYQQLKIVIPQLITYWEELNIKIDQLT